MKSELSIFRCLAFVSVSVASLAVAYKLGKDQHRTDPVPKSRHTQDRNVTLHEGQTIVGVSDTPRVMRFYIGDDGRDEKNYE